MERPKVELESRYLCNLVHFVKYHIHASLYTFYIFILWKLKVYNYCAKDNFEPTIIYCSAVIR